jgi:uncharacterized protein YoxC
MQVVIALCVVALTVVLILALVAVRRSMLRAELVLMTIEREIGPLIARLQGLIDDLRTLVRQSNREVERFGVVADRVADLTERAAHLVNVVSGFTRIGQIVGAATGIKKGLDVFITRLRRHGGHSDG